MSGKMKKIESEKKLRRKFIKDVSLASVVLGASSISSKIFAQTTQSTALSVRTLRINVKQQIIEKVLLEAMQTGEMTKALEKHGGSLAQPEKDALLSLTNADLASLRSIQTKLNRIGAASSVSGGVVF